MRVAPIGGEWPLPSRIWGVHAGTGEFAEAKSPLNGEPVQRIRLLSSYETQSLFQAVPPHNPLTQQEVGDLGWRISDAMVRFETELFAAMRLETGFSFYDCREMLSGCVQLLQGAATLAPSAGSSLSEQEYEVFGRLRRITLRKSPWGTVAVILPQNAFFIIALTAMLNALAAGNRIVLRAPLQSARSACLLNLVLKQAEAPQESISVVMASSRPFCDALYHADEPVLLHYLGSSRHAGSLLQDSFQNGTPLIVDGEGNCWIYVDEDFDAGTASRILARGALRYAGQTCTSINGAVIHPSVYGSVRADLKRRFEEANSMPLLDRDQADWCLARAVESGGQTLAGGRTVEQKLEPTLVETPRPDCALVREGVFGPMLWIMPGDAPQFRRMWSSNRFPLCAGVLTNCIDTERWINDLPRAARLSVNGDPSVESVFEPWGGYPMSGVNPVGPWIDKYVRVVQIDEPM